MPRPSTPVLARVCCAALRRHPADRPFQTGLETSFRTGPIVAISASSGTTMPIGSRWTAGTAGTVGPWALGEESQKLVHDIIGADEPPGWDHQLDADVALLNAPDSRRAIRTVRQHRARPATVHGRIVEGEAIPLRRNLTSHDMKVLIIGATGHVRRLTVDAALNDGHEVTAFGRSTDGIVRDGRAVVITN